MDGRSIDTYTLLTLINSQRQELFRFQRFYQKYFLALPCNVPYLFHDLWNSEVALYVLIFYK